ncbi:cold-shock protein [Candidatus Omnitrophota bacterium]
MASGKVKWFNEVKGYGFIVMDDEQEVFVHFTGIKGEGFRTLNEGEDVQFEVTESPKGLQAVNVQRNN